MLIVLNKKSGAGRASLLWDRSGTDILQIAGLDKEKYRIMEDEMEFENRIHEAVNEKEDFIVAAGGDGTVNRLVTVLMKMKKKVRERVTLGAIGLGSSNDFHKPFAKSKSFRGIPFLLDRGRSRMSNIIRIKTSIQFREGKIRYSIINSSLGVIAEGNRLFNENSGMTFRMKRLGTTPAIFTAAVISLLKTKPFKSKLTIQGSEREITVTNLSVILSPHFTGNLVYDTPIDRYQDHFIVNLAEGRSFVNRMVGFADLSLGRFAGRKGCHSLTSTHLKIIPERDVALEYDGEVEMVSQAEFDLVRGGIRLCG